MTTDQVNMNATLHHLDAPRRHRQGHRGQVMIYFYAFLAMLTLFVFAFAMFFGPIMIALELCTMGQMFGAMAVSAVVGLFVLWRMERDL